MSWLAALTYGPTPRTVAIQRLVGSGPPEVLDSAATIARRTIELPDAFENAGAMLVRDTLLRVQERVGDGGALTAVLLHSLLVEAGSCWQVALTRWSCGPAWRTVWSVCARRSGASAAAGRRSRRSGARRLAW